jgi:hypothetical protein
MNRKWDTDSQSSIQNKKHPKPCHKHEIHALAGSLGYLWFLFAIFCPDRKAHRAMRAGEHVPQRQRAQGS